MGITPTKKALLTVAIVPLVNYLPLADQTFQGKMIQNSMAPHAALSRGFKPNFVIVNGSVEEISSDFTNEIEAINSLMTIGNILFKDSRNETPNELKAIRSYFKSKYRKVSG